MESMVQHPLPGLETVPQGPARRRDHTRVWTDPAVGDARVSADRLHAEWRGAFVRFVSRLPPSRRAEIRRRIGQTDITAA